MPSQALLVELNDDLRTFHISLLCGNKIGFVSILPLHQKHQFSRSISGADDTFGDQSTIETFFSICLFLSRRLPFDRVICFAFLRFTGSNCNLKAFLKTSQHEHVNNVYLLVSSDFLRTLRSIQGNPNSLPAPKCCLLLSNPSISRNIPPNKSNREY